MNDERSTDHELGLEDPASEARKPELDVPRPSDDGTARGTGRRGEPGDPLVMLTLSRSQVDHIVRAVLGDDAPPNMSALVAGSGFHKSYVREGLGEKYRALRDNRRLSRSLLSGLLVLSCFSPKGVDRGINDLSQELDINTSTIHRYVLTLVAAGLLERDPDTRRYRLLSE